MCRVCHNTINLHSYLLHSVFGLPLYILSVKLCKKKKKEKKCLYFCPGLPDPAPFSVRWMCLMMDLQYTLSVYLSLCHSHLKGVKLCANMAVKNVFTSDLLHDPGLTLHTVLDIWTYNAFQVCVDPAGNFLAGDYSVSHQETSKCLLLFKSHPFE